MYQGGIDENIRVAIANGVPPLVAVQMGTINVAEIFWMQREIGALAPGRLADLLLVDSLVDFSIHQVMVGGETVVLADEFLPELPQIEYPKSFHGTVALEQELTAQDLESRVDGGASTVEVRVIGVTNGSLETDERRKKLAVVDGVAQPDFENDILPLVMVDRFRKGDKRIGTGFVQGFTLTRGAIASTVNAVCENLIAVGRNTEDMAFAMNHLAEIGGGKIVVADGEILALVELPLLGLLSEDPLAAVAAKFDAAFKAISEGGCKLDNPFSQLEFCFACGEIGDLKLSDEGLLLVNPPEKVELVVA